MEELTTAEAAERKGVSRAAVYEAIKQGRLRAHARRSANGMRTVYRVTTAALDEWTTTTTQSERGRRKGSGHRSRTEESRRRLAAELMGSMPKGRLSLADFLAAKHADADRER